MRECFRCLTILVLATVCTLAISGCMAPDKTPPGNVSGFTATAGDKQIVLAWTLPTDADVSGVRIQRKALTFPTSSSDGATAYDGNGATFKDANLDNGTLYCYTAFSYDKSHNFAAGVQASAKPTSAIAQTAVLSAIADARTSLSTFPSGVLDDLVKVQLAGLLDQVDGLYRAGDICGASGAVKDYLGALQGLRHDASMGAAELLYNNGRMIRYDMLSMASAKGLCPGEERVGQDAGATLDEGSTDENHVGIAFSFGEPKVFSNTGNADVYTSLTLPGVNSGSNAVGLPNMPVLTRLVAVPQGATVQASVISEEAEQIQMNLYPTQERDVAQTNRITGVTRDFSLPAFSRDEVFYKLDTFYPESAVSLTDLGQVRGLRMFRVEAPAGQYNPKTNTLRLFKSLNVKVTFTGNKTGYGFDPGNLFEPLTDITKELVINGNILGLLARIPYTGSTLGEELMIITHSKFVTSANALAVHKTNSGIVTNVFVADSVAGPPPTASSIRNLILEHWIQQ